MKILSIRLKNINSLRGEHFIPFDQSPFIESGLFAITGPTGAGKSSILDAITLALYGAAPRFDNDKPFEIMSYHTADCMAEVTFEAREKIYRSKWSIHRSRGKLDGEIQSPRMELVDVAKDVIIESKKTEVINKITEITGLDYFRFLRSVMLAQGEFAAFLKADKNVRGELLEKITGTDIYSRISRRAFEKQKEKKQRLEHLESQIDDSRLLSAEQTAVYQQQIAENKEKNNAISQEIELLTRQTQWLQALAQLQINADNLKNELQQVYQQQEFYKTYFEKYQLHLCALPFQAFHREVYLLGQQVEELSQDISAIKGSLPALEMSRNEATDQVSHAKKALEEAKNTQASSLPVIEQVQSLDKDLDNLRDQFKKIHEECNRLIEEINLYEEEKAVFQSRLTATFTERTSIQAYLEQHAHDACLESDLGLLQQNIQALFEQEKDIAAKTFSIRQLMQKQQMLKEKIQQLQEEKNKYATALKWTDIKIKESDDGIKILLNGLVLEDIEATVQELHHRIFTRGNQLRFSKSFVDNTEQIQFLQDQVQETQLQERQKTELLRNLKEKEKQAERELELLQQLFETQNLFVSYEEARQELRSGEPCPLCGSTHHPLATENPRMALSKTENERQIQKQLIDNLRSRIEAENTILNELSAKQKYALKDLSHKSREVATLEKEFEAINRQIHEQNLIYQPQVIEEKQEESIAEQKRLQQILLQYREKNKSLSIYKQQREADQHNLQQVEKQLIELQIAEENTGKELQKTQEDKERHAQDSSKQQTLLTSQLMAYQLTIPAESEFPQWIERLKKRLDTYKSHLSKEKIIGEEIHKLQLEIEKKDSALQKLQEQANLVSKEKMELLQAGKKLSDHRKALFGNKHPQQEKESINKAVEEKENSLKTAEMYFHEKQEILSIRQQQLTDKSLVLEKSRKDFQKKTDNLLSQLKEAGFAAIAHFQESLLDTATEAGIKQEKERLEQRFNELKGALTQNEKEYKELAALALTEAALPSITQLFQQVNHDKEALIAQTAQIEQILQENEKLQIKYAELTAGIEKQRQEYNRWKILSDMIGSASGAEFNVFAQGLTLARLVQLANKYLDKLNPRYQIRRRPHTDLELEITDRYQADNIRTMKTLSGGETFLVSLSLALGLSDLAGNTTRIDSLFIDEGFGTLDPDSLDTAITTLENLQASGKMIGIISHVDALKERITTQIQVNKLSAGVSTIEITG